MSDPMDSTTLARERQRAADAFMFLFATLRDVCGVSPAVLVMGMGDVVAEILGRSFTPEQAELFDETLEHFVDVVMKQALLHYDAESQARLAQQGPPAAPTVAEARGIH